MGESKRKQKTALAQAAEAMVVDTLGGRMHVQWDETAQATPNGQLVFFAERLRTFVAVRFRPGRQGALLR